MNNPNPPANELTAEETFQFYYKAANNAKALYGIKNDHFLQLLDLLQALTEENKELKANLDAATDLMEIGNKENKDLKSRKTALLLKCGELDTENQELKNEITDLNAKYLGKAYQFLNKDLADEVLELRTALEVYADEGNWKDSEEYKNDTWDLFGFGYVLAQTTLNELKGNE